MAFSPITTFTTSTVLTAAAMQGNTDALRVYLHDDIVAADLQVAKWIDTRHIQPPVFEPYAGIQHGVSGHQGGQVESSSQVRLTFATAHLTGNGIVNSVPNEWLAVPNTAFRVDIRRAANVLFHWFVEVEAGPDNIPYVAGRNYAITNRLAYFAPYIGNTTGNKPLRAQEVRNHALGLRTTSPHGGDRCYTVSTGYGQRDGTYFSAASLGTFTVGLCSYSQVDRVGVINWGVSIEVFYL